MLRLWQKIDFVKEGKKIKKYKFCGLTILRKEKSTNKKKWSFLGVKFAKKQQPKSYSLLTKVADKLYSLFGGSQQSLNKSQSAYQLIASSPYFDAKWYLNQYLDVAKSKVDPVKHYLQKGWKEGRNPSKRFDGNAYLRRYTDVKNAGVCPLLHYELLGKKEGRISGYNLDDYKIWEKGYKIIEEKYVSVDKDFYFSHYPEAKKSRLSAKKHYNTIGWKLGYNPNKYFNTKAYLQRYPDVKKANKNPLEHFKKCGIKEGRLARFWWQKLFNPFLCANPLQYSIEYKTIAKSKLFDSAWYLKRNKDVAQAKIDPIIHYLNKGWQENRECCLNFDGQKYLKNHIDVAAAQINPLVHFELYGKKEGRKFSEGKYKYHEYGIGYAVLRKIGQWLFSYYIKKNKKARILVHLHLYYMSAWHEIKEYLENLSPYHYDLVVTYAQSRENPALLDKIRAYKSDCVIIPCDNKGFDIGPFFTVINQVNLEKYDIIYHLHSKSVAGNKGRMAYNRLFVADSWFKQLFSGCLGVFNVHLGINTLLSDSKYGIICGNNLIFNDIEYVQKLIHQYADKYKVKFFDNYKFVGGSCCAYRSDIVKKIKQLNINDDTFSNSVRSVFSLAHALERLMSMIAFNMGYSIKGLPTLYNNHILTIYKANLAKKILQKKVISILKKYGLTDIKPFEINFHSGLLCSFFTGTYNKKKVFIKYGGVKEIVENEINMQGKAHKVLPDHTRKVVISDSAVPFIATEYIGGWNLEQLMSIGLTKKEKQNILSQLMFMKSRINAWPYIHRDIRPSNLMFENKKLFLIDFQFMCHKVSSTEFEEIGYVKEHPNLVKTLGKEYYDAANHYWNDVDAINKVIDEVNALVVKNTPSKVVKKRKK